jgi:hypothetical protein
MYLTRSIDWYGDAKLAPCADGDAKSAA